MGFIFLPKLEASNPRAQVTIWKQKIVNKKIFYPLDVLDFLWYTIIVDEGNEDKPHNGKELKKMIERSICFVDSETANFVDTPLPYDISYTIRDPQTWELLASHAFVVYEIFNDKNLMNSAYYAKKVPEYWEDIKSGKRTLARMSTIQKIIKEEFKKYHVDMVGAYNAGFDKRSTNNGIRYITCSKYRWFFPYGVEFFDIWHMACSSFMRSKHYIKWAIKNGFVSSAGNIVTNAETAYKYVTKNLEFSEEHKGLEDVLIEEEIFRKVYKCKMKFRAEIIGSPWRIVQNYREEFAL